MESIKIDAPLMDFCRLSLFAETGSEKMSFLSLFFKTAEDVLSEMRHAKQIVQEISMIKAFVAKKDSFLLAAGR